MILARRFPNRHQAGLQLAEKLKELSLDSAVIYALPRGGVIVGRAIADRLRLPLGLVIARKIGHPLNPEYAIGAVTISGPPVINQAEVSQLPSSVFDRLVKRERQEARRREGRYLSGQPPLSPAGKTAILVDDGVATGLTVRSAILELKERRPRQLIVAVPVIAEDIFRQLKNEVDRIAAILVEDPFLGAVGEYYDDFRAVTDEEVLNALRPSDHHQQQKQG